MSTSFRQRRRNPGIAVLLGINGLASALMVAVAYHEAHFNAARVYPATAHVQALLAGAVVVTVIGYLAVWVGRRGLALGCLFLGSASMAASPIVAYRATDNWPGGDDGGAMAWLMIVCGGALLCAALGIATLVTGAFLGISKPKSGFPVIAARKR